MTNNSINLVRNAAQHLQSPHPTAAFIDAGLDIQRAVERDLKNAAINAGRGPHMTEQERIFLRAVVGAIMRAGDGE